MVEQCRIEKKIQFFRGKDFFMRKDLFLQDASKPASPAVLNTANKHNIVFLCLFIQFLEFPNDGMVQIIYAAINPWLVLILGNYAAIEEKVLWLEGAY